MLLIVAVFILFSLAGCEISFTTANISNTIISDVEGASSVKDVFEVNTPVIYVMTDLKNAPEDTEIKAEWWYTESDTYITEYALNSTETNQLITFSLSVPDSGWPVGSYEVRLFIDGTEKAVIPFSVQ